MKYTPIFQQDNKCFVVPAASMVADSKETAWKLAMGVILVEGIMLNFKFSGEYLELSDEGKVNVQGWNATLGAWDVVILDSDVQDAEPL